MAGLQYVGDDVDRGTEVLRKAVAGWQQGGARLWMPMFLMLQAEGHAKAGDNEAALQAIERLSPFVKTPASAGLWPKCCGSRPPYCYQQAGPSTTKLSLSSSQVWKLRGANKRVAGNCARHVIFRVFGNARVETEKL